MCPKVFCMLKSYLTVARQTENDTMASLQHICVDLRVVKQ